MSWRNSLLRTWPVGIIALLGAWVYVYELREFAGPIDLQAAFLSSFSSTSMADHPGPEHTLVAVAAVMGLVSVLVVEWRMRAVGTATWGIAMPWCLVATVVGFTTPWFSRGTANAGLLGLFIVCVVVSGATAYARALWAEHAG